ALLLYDYHGYKRKEKSAFRADVAPAFPAQKNKNIYLNTSSTSLRGITAASFFAARASLSSSLFLYFSPRNRFACARCKLGEMYKGFMYRVGPPKLPPNIRIGTSTKRGPTSISDRGSFPAA